jgi:hypothetical protein
MVIDENNLDEVSAEDALRIGSSLMRHADEKFRELTGLPARV